MPELPTGTVTFLLTDVEGSTALWEEAPEAMRAALARHDVLFDTAVADHGGTHIRPRGEGDSRFAVFASAPDAVAAALAIQRAFAGESWPTPRPIAVRIGVHTGEAELRDGDYYGSAVNRCARIRGIGHGGQVLLSAAVVALVAGGLPTGASLTDLGEHRLKDLTQPERVAQVTAPSLPSAFPPLASLGARPHNLPIQPTALLGRDRAVAEVLALFAGGARLVTLTGPGGTGKTRLSMQVAAEVLDRLADGAWLVELAPISDPAFVPSTIAQALGLREFGSRPALDAVREHVRSRSLLLVLDNFEQILPAASVVADLLAASAGLKVLVTSREPLRLRGEVEYAVPPLTLPDASRPVTPAGLSQSPAVALFVERAAAVRTGFAVTDANAPAIAEICARLDGLPLAIELAAARARLLAPEAMVARLERRLPLLTGGARDLPARQQTLRDAIAWSHDLLDDAERRLFRRLAVFVGGWTLEAAEAVVGDGAWALSGGKPVPWLPARTDLDFTLDGSGDARDVLSGLDSLVAKSLVRLDEEAGAEPRFRMLETIREFGLEQLEASGEEAAVRRRHLQWLTDFAMQNEAKIHGPDMLAWMDQLALEHDNMRAALAWSLADTETASAETGLWLAGALGPIWFMHDHMAEGVEWFERLLAANTPVALSESDAGPDLSLAMLPPSRPNVHGEHPRVIALLHLGMFVSALGYVERSVSAMEEAVAVGRRFGDGLGTANAILTLAQYSRHVGDHDRARAMGEEGAALGKAVGDVYGIWRTHGMFGDILLAAGDLERAYQLHAESLDAARRLNDPWSIAQGLRRLGMDVWQQGDLDRATALLEEAVQRFAAVGVRRGQHWAAVALGQIALERGDLPHARHWFGEGVTLCHAVGERRWQAASLEGGAATLAAADGESLATLDAVARILGSAETLRARIGLPVPPTEQLLIDQAETAARAALGDEAFAAALADGAALTVDEAVDLAVGALARATDQS